MSSAASALVIDSTKKRKLRAECLKAIDKRFQLEEIFEKSNDASINVALKVPLFSPYVGGFYSKVRENRQNLIRQILAIEGAFFMADTGFTFYFPMASRINTLVGETELGLKRICN